MMCEVVFAGFPEKAGLDSRRFETGENSLPLIGHFVTVLIKVNEKLILSRVNPTPISWRTSKDYNVQLRDNQVTLSSWCNSYCFGRQLKGSSGRNPWSSFISLLFGTSQWVYIYERPRLGAAGF